MGLKDLTAFDTRTKKDTFFERLRAKLRQKQRPICENCGSPYFSKKMEIEGDLVALCLVCHAVNKFDAQGAHLKEPKAPRLW